MGEKKVSAKQMESELKELNDLHVNLNEILDQIHGLLRMAHDLRDHLNSTSLYFGSSTVRKVNLSKWNDLLAQFKEAASEIDTKLFERNENE
jgi:hypothetical protein